MLYIIKRKHPHESGYMTANTLPGRLVTVSGPPPLTIRNALPKEPKNITIYGNTIDGNGVGDVTANLLLSMTIGHGINATTGSEHVSNGAASSSYIPVNFTQHSNYCISGMVGKLYSFVAAYDSDKKFVGRTGATGTISRSVNSGSFTAGTPSSSNEIRYIRLTQYESPNTSGTIDMIASAKIMVNAGSAALPYEPFGYKIPLVSQGINQYYDDLIAERGKIINDNGEISRSGASGFAYTKLIPVKANTFYTLSGISQSANNTARRIHAYDSDGSWIGMLVKGSVGSGSYSVVGATTNTTAYIRLTFAQSDTQLILVEGSYTAETMPAYEPYVSPKTFAIYSDVELQHGDSITLKPGKNSAVRGAADISGFQDWSQDWSLLQTDTQIITLNTSVQPEKISLRYRTY